MTTTLADLPLAHTSVAGQQSVQSGATLGVQEDWARVGEKAGGACARGRGRGEETSFETAQTHGLYLALHSRVNPHSRNKIPRYP